MLPLDINVKFVWVRSPMYWCLRTLFKYRQLWFFLVILRRHQSIYQCKICFGSPKYWWLRILFKYRHPSFSSCHQTTSTCKEQHQRWADVWNRIFTNMKIIFTTTKWNFHIKYNWECLNFFKPFSGFGPLSRQPWHNQEYLIFISNIFFCNLDHFHFCDQDNQEYLIFISNIFSGTCSTSSCVSKTTMNILFPFQIFFLELAPLRVVWARQNCDANAEPGSDYWRIAAQPPCLD